MAQAVAITGKSERAPQGMALAGKISSERDGSDSSDQDGPYSQIRSWGAPKPPKAPKVCDTPSEAGAASYFRVLAALDERCPDHIEPNRWQRAVEDSRCFLATWGERAQALGWTTGALFGLHTPPEGPHPGYRRLSRYDETGLIWLLEGREVIALTKDTADIRETSGSTTVYRKNNKPALGQVGDSLDDFR
jgi:hypothetical protein